ncbi:MAG TPA: BrnT family toxin [Candidatus Brocadiales bacterium]|nr:BrnT family toxin [Candidatus Brocadiales bacterium]
MQFDWDAGNTNKNLWRHGVHDWEIEDAFLDMNRLSLGKNSIHGEERHILLGRCEISGKYLRIIYTIRTTEAGEKLIRPISAYEMSRTDKKLYLRKGGK